MDSTENVTEQNDLTFILRDRGSSVLFPSLTNTLAPKKM